MNIYDFYDRFNVSMEERGKAISDLKMINGSDYFDPLATVIYILATRLEKQAQEIQELKGNK